MKNVRDLIKSNNPCDVTIHSTPAGQVAFCVSGFYRMSSWNGDIDKLRAAGFTLKSGVEITGFAQHDES